MSGRHPRRHVWGGGAFACVGPRSMPAVALRALREFSLRSAAMLVVVLLPLAGLAVQGCSLHQEGVRPPDNRIFFPGGAIIEGAGPGVGKWLYVVNSNSDLRYNAGTVVAVDLSKVRADYQDEQGHLKEWGACRPDSRWVPPANVGAADRCCWDSLDPNILNCDEQLYVRRESSVRIGNFAGRPVIQQLPPAAKDGASRRRLFVPVRGDASIGMIEVAATSEAATFRCTGARTQPGDTDGQFPICEPQWQIKRGDDDNAQLPDSDVPRLPDEPYALAVDDLLQVMYVGHLRGGSVSLINLGDYDESRTPELLQSYPNLLPGDANGSQGVTSLTIKKKGCFGPVYVTSRYLPLVGTFVVYGLETCQAPPPMEPQSARGIAIVGTGQFLGTGLNGAETRGIEFMSAPAGQEPDRAFILQRTPPALVAVNTATQLPFATLEVCQSPTNLVQQTDAAGNTVALFVTCFDAGEVYVIDPLVPRVRAVIPVGRGPVATVLPPPDAAPADLTRGYVVGFGANNISVVDLDPQSPTRYRVIQRVGFSSPTPREVGPQ